MTSKVTYVGELRTSCVHIQSSTELLTDAPTDNHGKGEAFSPTDLVATALASCMISLMGIKVREMDGVSIEGSTAEVVKVMQPEPRKITRVEVVFNMKSNADEKTRTILERVAKTCPVGLSLNTDIEQVFTFNWYC